MRVTPKKPIERIDLDTNIFYTHKDDATVAVCQSTASTNRCRARNRLKQGLEKYFEEETDFCRQLDDFEPNWKFSSSKDMKREEAKVGGDSEMSLGDLVQTLKSDMDVKKVYCWHALHGYWRGVTNEVGDSIGINVTQIFTKPSEKLIRMEPQMAYDTPTLFGAGLIDSKSNLKTFYDHLHTPLVNAGVDGVKVDVQSGISAAGSGVQGKNQLAMAYTQAMENSVNKRFPGEEGGVEVINCMCHNTENLYRYDSTTMARASDDFYPERSETWTTHLVNVAYNSKCCWVPEIWIAFFLLLTLS